MNEHNSIRRILVIDDNPAIHYDFRKVLCGARTPEALETLEAALFDSPSDASPAAAFSFEIDSAHQGAQGVDMLKVSLEQGRPYPLAFVDMRMPPGMDGVQTIRELWKIDKRLQVVICTAYSDYTPDQIAAAVGISDQLLILRKPFEPAEVRQIAVTLCDKWEVRHQHTELQQMIQTRTAELQHAALHDHLTGLPNRVLFNDRVDTALRRARREKDYRFAVLFVDCDRFKIVNDSLGHGAGDQLLLEIARRLQTCVRDVDTVTAPPPDPAANPLAARFGGDEFAILLDRVRDDSDAARVAQRVVDALSMPYNLNGQEVQNSASIGIATSSSHYQNAEEMIRDADIAMYRAKRSGGSSFVMFDQRMHQEALNVLMIENDLRRAVQRGELVLHYQPIVDMRSQALLGFEALVRWNHPKRGLLQPDEFIPQAEQTGIIVSLGNHVLEQACRQLAEWQRAFPDFAALSMSVNISRRQLENADMVAHLARVIGDSGIRPENLKLEITEAVNSEDHTRTAQVLRQIQDLRVQLQIDDFGCGYSSLSALQNVPMNGLKIDRQFIEQMSRPEGAAIVRSVVSLAHNLRVPLVAEGIETAEQHKALQSMGCDHAQGYLFSRPMEAKVAEKFIRDQIANKKPNAA